MYDQRFNISLLEDGIMLQSPIFFYILFYLLMNIPMIKKLIMLMWDDCWLVLEYSASLPVVSVLLGRYQTNHNSKHTCILLTIILNFEGR